MIKKHIARIVQGNDLSEVEMEETMEEIMTGRATPAQIASFITALRIKGESVDEITGAARVMRNKAKKVRTGIEILLDTCGTGGDSANSFNISTTVAFVAAGGGIKVAKHGNRAVSSKCGSADVLEALGVNLDIGIDNVAKCIKEIGIGFLFAPVFHSAMKYATGPRREIGLRTIFNLLGPLTNPAGTTVQVMGVYDPNLTEKIAHVLGRLGIKEAFVVSGEGPMDEISLYGSTRVSHLNGDRVQSFEIRPEEYGFEKSEPDNIKGGDAHENARIIIAILNGERGPRRDMVILNSAPAFIVAGKCKDMHEGIEMAKESIDSGRARKKLEKLIKYTRSCNNNSI